MIGVFLEAGFPPRKFLKMAFGTLGTALLQALSKPLVPLAVALDKLSAKGFPKRVSRQVDDPEINAERISWYIWSRGRNFQRDSQIPYSIAVQQIGLPFDTVQAGLLVSGNV